MVQPERLAQIAEKWSGGVRQAGRRLGILVLAGLVGLGNVPVASAHEGTVHSATPHWGLLGLTLIGLGIAGASLMLGRHHWTNRPQRVLGGVIVGIVFITLGTIGLVEIQVDPTTAPQFSREWYELIAFFTGASIMLASVIVGWIRWPHRPSYTGLGILLGLWVAYPVLVPGLNGRHPLGYLLVVSVPLVIGYILWRDIWPALEHSLTNRRSRLVTAIVGLLFTVFFLVSTGLLTFNPDTGATGSCTGTASILFEPCHCPLNPAAHYYPPRTSVKCGAV